MRMIYDAKTFEPSLLISGDFHISDVGAKFWVYNGAWDGIWLGDTYKCDRGGFIPSDIYKIYDFTNKPPLEYFDLICYKEDLVGVNYGAWFAHFRDLVEQGVI